MFKAWDSEAQRDVISLDFYGAELDALRQKGRTHVLRCPVCKHPVKVRSSERVSTHFAHWHLGDCPSSHEPPELLIARAALYRWLKKKFADGVTLENRPIGVALPRSIDGWVESEGHRIMYWLAPGGMRPDGRDLLSEAAKTLDAQLHVVFLKEVMRRNGTAPGRLNLTTTEREFLTPSRYDVLYNSHGEGSLHYLDGDSQCLHTFRAMRCIEAPQRYEGAELATALDDVLASRTTEAFVHPGEHDWLKAHQEQEARAREARERADREREAASAAARRAQAERQQREFEEQQRQAQERAAAFARWQEREGRRRPGTQPTSQQAAHPVAPTASPAFEAADRTDGRTSLEQDHGTIIIPLDGHGGALSCIFCGERTHDWWKSEGNGTCRCKKCYARGICFLPHEMT